MIEFTYDDHGSFLECDIVSAYPLEILESPRTETD